MTVLTQYDVVIVGGGPAGLTAALYTARRKLSTLVVSKDIGGQAATTSLIENYPGVGPIDGLELMQQFRAQAEQYGAEVILGDVHGLTKTDDGFVVSYNNEQVKARSVILAFGLTPRSLDVPGEQAFSGKGVWYSTTAAAHELRGKTVTVIGGGNSAIESVNLLSDIAKQVYLVHRRDRFRAEAILIQHMEEKTNVTKVVNAQIKEIKGTDHVTSIVVLETQADKTVTEREIEVDAVCVNVGFMSKTGFVEQLVNMTEKHEIIVNPDCTTSHAGIFAAGDITTSKQKQVVVSAGEGCKAALACNAYLATLDGKTVEVNQDWKVTSGPHFIRS